MSPIQRILDLFRRAYNSLSTNIIDAVKAYVQVQDNKISSAVAAAFKVLGVTKILQNATKESMMASYQKAIGKTISVFPSKLASAWDASGMTLSEKIHGVSKEMRQAITDTIRAQLKANNHAMTAARALYDGYNSGIAVTRSQSVPKYLDDILDFARHSNLSAADRKIMLMRVRQARKQVDKLAQGGAPNRALKTAYTKLLDAVEDGTDKALDNAIHTAVQEKSRYIAERVARTESARAWAQGFADRYMDDDTVVAFRWKLAARHPRYDICNLYAEADLWGLGKGIYPKDKTPVLPVHPHCLCHLAPVYQSELDKVPVDRREEGGREYLEKLSLHRRQQILGVQGNTAVADNDNWTKWARNYSPSFLCSKLDKLDIKNDIMKVQIDGIGEAHIHLPKLTKYALNPQKDKNKAKAFSMALGYTLSNVDDLLANVKANINSFERIEKPSRGYGKRFEISMDLTGPNGKTATVLTGWIIDESTEEVRLTTIYVDKRKGGGKNGNS